MADQLDLQAELTAVKRAVIRERRVSLVAIVIAGLALAVASLGHIPRQRLSADTIEARRFVLRGRTRTAMGEFTAEGEYGRPELIVGERKSGAPRVALGAGDRIALRDANGSVLEMWPYGMQLRGGAGSMEIVGGCMVSTTKAGQFVFPDLALQKPVAGDRARARIAEQWKPAPLGGTL